MVTLITVDKGTLITVTFLCDDVITQSDTRKHINNAVIIDYDIFVGWGNYCLQIIQKIMAGKCLLFVLLAQS